MRFCLLTDDTTEHTELAAEYAAARALGPLRLGSERLYLRRGLRTLCIPYSAVTRCRRRMIVMPEALRREGAAPALETLVLYGSEGQELAQISLPGATACRIVLAELHARLSTPQEGA